MVAYGPLLSCWALRNTENRLSTADRFASIEPRIKAACLLPPFDVPCLLPISLPTVLLQLEECTDTQWLVYIGAGAEIIVHSLYLYNMHQDFNNQAELQSVWSYIRHPCHDGFLANAGNPDACNGRERERDVSVCF